MIRVSFHVGCRRALPEKASNFAVYCMQPAVGCTNLLGAHGLISIHP